MEQNELMNRIAELEREIAVLPEGSITRKKIKDKEYYYHRVTRDGKRSEQYVSFEEVANVSAGQKSPFRGGKKTPIQGD